MTEITAPVLFLVFNRPQVTQQVFEKIRLARPARLYVACDGPRDHVVGEAAQCAEVRDIATNVDWPCELRTLFRDRNLGCKHAVSDAISWFFDNEEEGIILEDDCLPGEDFFAFCSAMLRRFRDDERIWTITGDNFQSGQLRGESSYYFSKYAHIWGWATWRRAWEHYDVDMKYWPQWRRSKEWKANSMSRYERWYWTQRFNKAHGGGVDTWDYPWLACIWRHDGLTVTPNVNLVENIGIAAGGTHMTEQDSRFAIPAGRLGGVVHNSIVCVCQEADKFVYRSVYHQSPLSILKEIFNLAKKKARELIFN